MTGPNVPVDWILRGARELEAQRAAEPAAVLGDELLKDHGLRPGSDQFVTVLDEIRQLHLRKTQDYGADDDAFANIRFGAEVVNIEPWQACLVRICDKVQRLKAFCHNGRVEFDGLEDTLLDLASYAVIAEVERRRGARGPAESAS